MRFLLRGARLETLCRKLGANRTRTRRNAPSHSLTLSTVDPGLKRKHLRAAVIRVLEHRARMWKQTEFFTAEVYLTAANGVRVKTLKLGVPPHQLKAMDLRNVLTHYARLMSTRQGQLLCSGMLGGTAISGVIMVAYISATVAGAAFSAPVNGLAGVCVQDDGEEIIVALGLEDGTIYDYGELPDCGAIFEASQALWDLCYTFCDMSRLDLPPDAVEHAIDLYLGGRDLFGEQTAGSDPAVQQTLAAVRQAQADGEDPAKIVRMMFRLAL